MIRIAVPEHAEEHVSFSTAPLLESVLSLHVFLGPGHHYSSATSPATSIAYPSNKQHSRLDTS